MRLDHVGVDDPALLYRAPAGAPSQKIVVACEAESGHWRDGIADAEGDPGGAWRRDRSERGMGSGVAGMEVEMAAEKELGSPVHEE